MTLLDTEHGRYTMTNNSIVKGSLTDLALKQNTSIAEAFLNCDMVVIVDTSGSMAAQDAPGDRSRYKAACDELKRLQESYPGKIAVISFSSFPVFCPNGEPQNLGASTDMVEALKFIKPADDTGTQIVLVSDGDPDSPDKTLKIARTFKTKIDTLFCGPESGYGSSGRDFLRQLSEATGGKHFDSKAPGLLAESVETLLLSG